MGGCDGYEWVGVMVVSECAVVMVVSKWVEVMVVSKWVDVMVVSEWVIVFDNNNLIFLSSLGS